MLRAAIVTTFITLALVATCRAPHTTALPWSSASLDPQVVNVVPAKFADGSGVTEAVLHECDLEHLLPEWVAQYTPVPIVLAVSPTDGTRILELTVTSILAPPGGTWTGIKQLVVHGDLIEGGQVIASFDAQRTTMAGGWAAGGGTCEVLDYVSESIAKDIRPWLANPTPGALLGELR
jgi:hypothetical protein